VKTFVLCVVVTVRRCVTLALTNDRVLSPKRLAPLDLCYDPTLCQ